MEDMQIYTSYFSRLQAISQGKDVVLLCWESAGEFCHRHLIVAWLGEDPEQCELSFGLK